MVGALFGLLGPVVLDPGSAETAALQAWSMRLLDLALESAPALLLGFVLAGVGAELLPNAPLRWLRRGPPIVRSARGMLFGLPLPVCSCGVVPMYRSLIARGASPTAALAFLVATPELGIEALIISVPFLGWELTIARLLAAALVALIAGWWVGQKVNDLAADVRDEAPKSDDRPLSSRLRAGLRFGFVDIVDDIAAWLVVGLALAALVDPTSAASGWGASLPPGAEVIAFALLGLPVYVCASGATPMAAAMLAVGVSPGAVLAFLLAGPATNVTTYGVLTQLHGAKIAWRFGVAVVTLAILSGLAVDAAFPAGVSPPIAGAHEHTHGPIAWVCLPILAVAFVGSVLRKGPRRFASQVVTLGA